MCWGMDSTNVCCIAWHQDISGRSLMSCKLWGGTSMDQSCWYSTLHICSIRLRVRHLESHATPQTIPEQSSRCIIMIKEDTAIREHYFQVLCNILGRWYISKNCNIHRNARTQGFPAELCPEMASIIHSVRFQSSLSLLVWFGPDMQAFASHMHQWALDAHDPYTGSLFVHP